MGIDSEDAIFQVVVNDEEQYSIWPEDMDVPAGWRATGPRGTKQECLSHIEEVWTDMRPRSVRDQLDAGKR
jgi:MbtH protein